MFLQLPLGPAGLTRASLFNRYAHSAGPSRGEVAKKEDKLNNQKKKEGRKGEEEEAREE